MKMVLHVAFGLTAFSRGRGEKPILHQSEYQRDLRGKDTSSRNSELITRRLRPVRPVFTEPLDQK